MPTLTPDDAGNIARVCRDDPPEELDAVKLRDAALALDAEVARLESELSRWRATAQRLAAAEGRAASAGAPLELRWDSGGRRHYLNGEPVHAGAQLAVLTPQGWLRCRYESRHGRAVGAEGLTGLAYIALAGSWEGAAFAIPDDARLAWPADVGLGR